MQSNLDRIKTCPHARYKNACQAQNRYAQYKNRHNMIKLQRFIPFFLLTIIFEGCIEIEKKSTLTIITGNVKNMDVYPDTKEFSVNIIDFRGEKTTISDSIKSDGSFKMEFDLYKTQDLDVNPLVGKIIASPGDSIHIDIDFKDIVNIQFSGDNQKTNADLFKFFYSNNSVIDFRGSESNRKSISAYKCFCDSVKDIAEQKRDYFIKETNPLPLFLDWTKDYININYQKSLLVFPFNYAIINKLDYHDLELPNDYYNFLDDIGNNFSDTIINTLLYGFLNVYTSVFAERTIIDTTFTNESYISKLLSELIDKHEQSFFKQILIGNLFYLCLNNNDLDSYTDNKKVLEKNVHDPSIRIPLNIYYIELQKHLKNPEINSNGSLSKLNGTSGRTLIDSILVKNKGKVIYIDFWATWCGPCKEEMPNSKKLKQQLACEDIEFVYICFGSNEEEWKSYISQMQLDGQHYFCKDKQSSSIQNAFDINGIPFYMLINRNGHIVESGLFKTNAS